MIRKANIINLDIPLIPLRDIHLANDIGIQTRRILNKLPFDDMHPRIDGNVLFLPIRTGMGHHQLRDVVHGEFQHVVGGVETRKGGKTNVPVYLQRARIARNVRRIRHVGMCANISFRVPHQQPSVAISPDGAKQRDRIRREAR